MSMFGIRKKVKKGLKSLLGFGEEETSSPSPWKPEKEEHTPKAVQPVPEPPKEEPKEEAKEEAQAEAPVQAKQDAKVVDEPVRGPESTNNVLQPEEDIVGQPLNMEAVQEILDDMVRPALQSDGGDISLIKIEENNIYVELVGACSTCPSSIMTMKMGVEALLKEEFPSMNELIDITTIEQGA